MRAASLGLKDVTCAKWRCGIVLAAIAAGSEDSMSYYDLGTYSRKITTTSPEAQTWFDRGLTWVYAFNHEESVKCFKKALEHDPDCAICLLYTSDAADE